MSPQFSALLIFYTFHGSKSLHLHLQGPVAKVEFFEATEQSCLFSCVKTHLWGKTWPYSDPNQL